jgi:thiamine kinase-like enzyme
VSLLPIAANSGTFGQVLSRVCGEADAGGALDGFWPVRALDVAQPVVVDGSAATFWEAISDGESYAPLPQVAELIKRLHSLVPPPDLKLPDFEPFGAICSRLAASTWLGDDDAEFLSERTHRVQALYGDLNFSLPRGVIHGDANVGNVLQDDDGRPVLIDLDSFAIGPREWDLVQTAMFYDRFGWHTRSEYNAFVAIYGFDIMSWPGYPVLRDIRELHMVTWLTQNANTDHEVAVEAAKRIDALRTGASRRDWKPY